jgi:protein-S-isoprenylcysteine O-methyltransferase Ste14
MAGLFGMLAWIALARTAPDIAAALGVDWGDRGPLDGPWAALINVAACGIPMVLWSLFVDKIHRNPTTGIDWSVRKPVRDTLDVSLTKLAGLWATWGAIACFYLLGRWYWQGNYLFAMELFEAVAPFLFIGSIPYVLWIDRYLIDPRDGAWHLGQWMIGQPGWDRTEIEHHARAWAVKGFFLAFMVSIVPGGYANLVTTPIADIAHDPVALAQWLIGLTFVVDVGFATVGYLLTMKPLDSHIRTANPYLAAWVAALICYPPFILMSDGGVLDYHPGTAEWTYWLEGQPVLLALTGAMLLVLTGVYAWATVAFGLRFSNLTHRGILTHGPYAWTKHPAYLAKNAFWWLSSLPFLATSGSLADAARNTALLAAVTGVYYWRAKTEEKHLGADPDYVAYAEWMAEHGPITRRIERLLGRSRPTTAVPAE